MQALRQQKAIRMGLEAMLRSVVWQALFPPITVLIQRVKPDSGTSPDVLRHRDFLGHQLQAGDLRATDIAEENHPN